MLDTNIETLSNIIYAFTQISDRSPEYKALCAECIIDLERVKYDLSVVNEFIDRAKVLLGED